jgi:hypothetical protein
MILHKGERVYWGAPEIMYLEGTIVGLATQTVVVHVDRATPHSAHLIGTDIPFAADGLAPLKGDSPPGTTNEPHAKRLPPLQMSDEEKIRRAASVAVHQQYGYNLPSSQEQPLIEQVTQALNSDPAMRTHIIASIDEILQREHA